MNEKTMNEMEKIHGVFAQIWKMFNDVRRNDSDEGWEICVNDARRIAKENPGRMYEKLILAVLDEVEDELKIQNAEEKKSKYKAAAKAFNESWRLYESLMRCLDINAVAMYCNDNTGKMAKKLSAAIYEAACGVKNTKGNFMEAAYAFYEKYEDKVDSDEAFVEAEEIINKYPEHTIQMMELYDKLKRRTEISVCTAA